MSNIWEFLLQTATVSLTAGLLLLLKKLFEDKLPPRWQYTIWFLLALRILLPAATRNRYILLPLPVWIEALKSIAEQNLSASAFGPSLFSAPFDPVHLTSGLPWPTISEQSTYYLAAGTLESGVLFTSLSITDWLFLLYIAGILVFLLRYAASYGKLRVLLRQNTHPVSPEVRNHVHEVAKKYSLKICPIVLVEGLPSAFVCGIFRPVLALPYTAAYENGGGTPQKELADTSDFIDEKILLHELLHLKYYDALQSIFWSLLRALHWCNPFLHYIFDRIGNDMEALCDQRVLERLEGEDRRDYGRILLGMTNDRYPRAFGTTSLSNGAANIARRIGYIARFKKYPKGMELVSVCIALMLLSPLFMGSQTDYANDYKVRSLELDMAITRLERCTTLSGAVDTFAKGLLTGEITYLASASPLEENGFWYQLCEGNNHSTRIPQDPLTDMNSFIGGLQQTRGEYYLYNLRPAQGASNRYEAEYLFPLHWVTMPEEEWPDDGMKFYDRSWADPVSGYCIYPVAIEKKQNRWQVSRRSDFVTGLLPDDITDDSPAIHSDPGMLALLTECNPAFTYSASGGTGEVLLQYRSYYTVDKVQNSNTVFGTSIRVIDNAAKKNVDFQWRQDDHKFTFRFSGSEEERNAIHSIAVLAVPLEMVDSEADFSRIEEKIAERNTRPSSPHISLNASDGSFAEVRTFQNGEWNGTMSGGGGSGGSLYGSSFRRFLHNFGLSDSVPFMQDAYPEAYAVRILINGELTEELTLTHEGGGNS